MMMINLIYKALHGRQKRWGAWVAGSFSCIQA